MVKNETKNEVGPVKIKDEDPIWVLEEFVSEGQWRRLLSKASRADAVMVMENRRTDGKAENVQRVIPVLE